MFISFGDTDRTPGIGDTVELQKQSCKVVRCQETGVKMLNIDADELHLGDLAFIKKLGLTISNPETTDPVALGVDYNKESFAEKVVSFLSTTSSHDHDDSSFFGGGGFGGGFGGFGGGSFSGGGASGSW
jgi:uncharacterized membrane protein YgcG